MTKNGNLSNRDRETILRAARIAEAWVNAQTKQGHTTDNSFLVREIDHSASMLKELLFETR